MSIDFKLDLECHRIEEVCRQKYGKVEVKVNECNTPRGVMRGAHLSFLGHEPV